MALKSLDLICFPGAPNLPIFAAQEKGFFEEAGVVASHETTPSSVYQAKNLVSGNFQIAGTAIDNVVAYQEGQGVAKLDKEPDLFAFMGATQIELAFVVAPEVETFDDLKGKTLALDAQATGFAFVLYRMLNNAGLTKDDYELVPVGATPDRWKSVEDGTHAGTLTIEPFTSMALAKGFRVLESSLDTFDDYQGGSFAASRAWAEENEGALLGYIIGYLKGLAWTLNEANYQEASELLLKRMPAINPKAIDKVMGKLLNPRSGLTPLGKINMKGFQTVLELRSQYVDQKAPLNDPGKYIDLSFYEKALKAL